MVRERLAVPSQSALDVAIAARRRRRRTEATLAAVFAAWGYDEVGLPLLAPVEPEANASAAPGAGDGPAASVHNGHGGAAAAPAGPHALAAIGTAYDHYRIIDRDGALLALRPDMTGPIARLCALGDAGGARPRRLFYLATLFRRGDGGGPRELPQAGAELIGAAGPLADAEALALCADLLCSAGVPRFRLAVGHVGLLRRLLGADADAGCEALGRRDFVALAERLRSRPEVARAVTWRGSAAQVLAGAAPWEDADLNAALTVLGAAGLGDVVGVEVGLLRPGGYYNGMVFEVSVPGRPRPLGGGGRYDGLAGEPATGFAIDMDELMAVCGTAGAESGVEAGGETASSCPGRPARAEPSDERASTLIVAAPGAVARAWAEAAALRAAGGRAVVDGRPLAEARAYARATGCRELRLVPCDGPVEGWTL